MTPYSSTEAWAAVALAFLGTFIWRFLGVLLAERITPDGPLMQWVNAVALFDGRRCDDADSGVSGRCSGNDPA